MSIAIFHHLHPVNYWENLYSEQMHRLCASGLYKASDFIHVGFNSKELHLPFELDKVALHRNDVFSDDVDTLNALYQFCFENPHYKVFYFTNLGITKGWDLNKSGWRLMLEYFNIDRWRKCVDLLESYDCVGAESHFGIPDRRPGQSADSVYRSHYSGNWWWATAKYIRTLNPSYISRNDTQAIRERAEWWIGTGTDVKHYDLYSTGHYGGLYGHFAKPTDYIME